MNFHRIRISSKYKQSFCRKDNFVKFVYLGQFFFFKFAHMSLCIYQGYYLLGKLKTDRDKMYKFMNVITNFFLLLYI